MTQLAIAYLVGIITGLIVAGALILTQRRRTWRNRYRPHRYEEIL